MLDLLRKWGLLLRETGSVLWRCIYSAGLTVLGLFVFGLVPQGLEVLRLFSDPGWNFPLFLAAMLAWSLAAWYSARLTLGRVFDGGALADRDAPYVNLLRRWLPRLLGVAPGAVLAGLFWRLGLMWLALACATATLLLAVFLLCRRRWFRARFHDGGGAPLRFWQLQRGSLLTVVGAIVLTFALLLAVWRDPVGVTGQVTAPVLLCFALASWILFGDLVLTYFFKQARLPSMAALPLLLFIVASPWNDNHGVALLAERAAPPARPAPGARLRAWLDARLASGELREDVPFPVFLVAAEGGGIRAAYWGGNVLARLQDDSGGRFGRHLFALSAVSGGALGSAVFTALLADGRSGALARAPCGAGAAPYLRCTRAVLRRDYLSPLVGYLLYPDMLQRFLPAPVASFDRARAMEAALRAGWRDAIGSDRFGQRFDHLWDGGQAELPALLLNTTLVAGGNRLIESDVQVDASFPDAYDAFDPLLDLGGMSLATAVHNSARFSYVSPAGAVSGCRRGGVLAPCGADEARSPWGRLIDGAYFEGSGAETVRDLLFAMRPVLQQWKEEKGERYLIEPVVIVISNAPGARAPAAVADPRLQPREPDFLSELLAPPTGLYNTRFARAAFAVVANRRDLAPGRADEPVHFYWFGLSSRDAPLGWALADGSFDGMDRLLAAPDPALPFAEVLARLP